VIGEADLFREGLLVAEAVVRRVNRRLGRLAELDDMRSIAKIALYDVVRAYDPHRSAFAPYVASRIKWALFDEVRRQTHGRSAAARVMAVAASERFAESFDPEADSTGELSTELPTEEEWQARLAAMLEGHAAALVVGLVQQSVAPRLVDDDASPEELTARAEMAAQVRRSVGALPERERALVERHYFEGEPFDANARDLGIRKSWASRLHDRANAQLSRELRAAR